MFPLTKFIVISSFKRQWCFFFLSGNSFLLFFLWSSEYPIVFLVVVGIWSDDLTVQDIDYLHVLWFVQDALRLYLINSPVVRAESLNFKEEGVYAVVSVLFLWKTMDWNVVIRYIGFFFLFVLKMPIYWFCWSLIFI